MNQIIIILLCLAGVYMLGKVISIPAKAIKQVVINVVLGTLMLYLINYVGMYFNYSIPFSNQNAIIIGLLGVPGVIAIVVMKYLGI